MNIIIVGCGRVGQTLAENLNNDGNDVTVVDLSPSKVKEVTDRVDVMGVIGNGATHSTLQEAGINNADLFIAVTNSDELNLLCCMVAKKEGDCDTIARVKSPEDSAESLYLKEQLGLAMVINPQLAAAEEIARVMRFPTAIKVEPFAKGRVSLIKFRLPSDSPLIGMSVVEVINKYHPEILLCTVERGDEAYIVNGSTTFKEKDIISLVSTTEKAHAFFKKINFKGNAVKDAVIAGGGNITHYLCSILEKSKIALTVIERDQKVCEELSSTYPKTNVIFGDALNKELLFEEGISNVDAFVALTNHDEDNILLSLFYKEEGHGKLFTKINRTDYGNVINKLDFDTVICPKNITSDIILRFVRASANTKGSNVETLYNVVDGKVEASEFLVKAGSPIIGIPLSKLTFKPNVLVAAITRDDKVIIPRGQDVIQENDYVVVVTKELSPSDVTDVLDQ